MGLNKDFEHLTKFSKLKLRSAAITDLFGSVLADDLKKHPIKVAPYFVIPAPLVPSLTMLFIAAGTIAYKARSAEFRQQFKDAMSEPVSVSLYKNAVHECPKTGKTYACSLSLFKRRLGALKNGTNFLMEYHMEKFPRHWMFDALRNAHKKISRHPFPAIIDAPDNPHSSMKGSWKGAVFALASLGNMEPSDITPHLAPRDRELFLQEYATAEI